MNVGKGKDRGIIMVRYFIHTREAMKVIPGMPAWLLGDDQGYSNDLDQPYRMVLFWDTASGDVTFKVAPSHTLPQKKTISSYLTGGAPIEVESPSKQLDANQLLIDGSDNSLVNITADNLTLLGKNVLQTRDSNSQRLNLGVHGVQPVMSVGAVDNDITLAANDSSVTVTRAGNAYPDMKAVQYRRSSDAKAIARDSMDGESGFASITPWTNINRSWTNSRCVKGCS
ncbi:hypothetical protein [Streptomyces celluloflavus]|uniref:hypothetical protein n=1 Tax=Streptomyces celluloflavus TaxID=58344 RepID=UPI003690F762